ncbi:hypothetical protein [Granulicella rosea]|uniref:hypothetical protein n=1 Tax=Granulicella rosea TaxID=474952 RepID=UPI000B76C450|nr:hypothetical protein [Granulicella rosea]
MSIDDRTRKLEGFSSLPITRFCYLKNLVIEKDFQPGRFTCDVELLLAEDTLPESPRLRLKFIKAADIRIGDLNALFALFMSIRDVADRQLEDITYRVVEEEHSSISLYCRDFEYEVLE